MDELFRGVTLVSDDQVVFCISDDVEGALSNCCECVSLTPQLDAYGVQQEWHVPNCDLDHGIALYKTIDLNRGVEDAHKWPSFVRLEKLPRG